MTTTAPKKPSVFSSIRIFLVEGSETLKANASCLIGNTFYVTNMRIVQGKNGLFLAMPSRKDAKGEYHDIAFPSSKEVRDELQRAILEEFERCAHGSPVAA